VFYVPVERISLHYIPKEKSARNCKKALNIEEKRSTASPRIQAGQVFREEQAKDPRTGKMDLINNFGLFESIRFGRTGPS
jgi:hypothetical protein